MGNIFHKCIDCLRNHDEDDLQFVPLSHNTLIQDSQIGRQFLSETEECEELGDQDVKEFHQHISDLIYKHSGGQIIDYSTETTGYCGNEYEYQVRIDKHDRTTNKDIFMSSLSPTFIPRSPMVSPHFESIGNH